VGGPPVSRSDPDSSPSRIGGIAMESENRPPLDYTRPILRRRKEPFELAGEAIGNATPDEIMRAENDPLGRIEVPGIGPCYVDG
jgi:hypothetical protein